MCFEERFKGELFLGVWLLPYKNAIRSPVGDLRFIFTERVLIRHSSFTGLTCKVNWCNAAKTINILLWDFLLTMGADSKPKELSSHDIC